MELLGGWAIIYTSLGPGLTFHEIGKRNIIFHLFNFKMYPVCIRHFIMDKAQSGNKTSPGFSTTKTGKKLSVSTEHLFPTVVS